MKRNKDESFERLLDQCLDEHAHGETVDVIMERHPADAEQLEPYLRTAARIEKHSEYQPSEATTMAARERLNRARIARATTPRTPSPSLADRLIGHPRLLASVATLTVIALTAILVVKPAMETPPSLPIDPTTAESDGTSSEGDGGSGGSAVNPTEPPTEGSAATENETPGESPDATLSPPAAAEGNFAFFVSDQPNDIGDFETLIIEVSGIQIKPSGEGPWIDIVPETKQADLVQLQGNRALKLWQGDIPEGDYTRVVILVDSVLGVLDGSGDEIEVKLPSGKLHVDCPFSVSPGESVEFVFDITVHSSGQPGAVAYILSPQASESGVGQSIEQVAATAAGYAPDEKPGKEGDAPQEGPDGTPDMNPPGPGRDQKEPRLATQTS